MKKHISRIAFICAVAAGLLCSCDNKEVITDSGEGIRLSVSTPDVTTKAFPDGDDLYNENRINSVYYFIYKDGETTAAPVLKGFYAGLDFTGEKTWVIPVSPYMMNTTLFPTGTDNCRVVVVANPTSDIVSDLEGSPTLTEVRGLVVESSLKGTQDNFVMVYDQDVTVASRTADDVLTINANMSRLANKITVKAKIAHKRKEEVTGWWVSDPENATVIFYNGVNKTTLSGDFSAVKAGLKKSNHFASDESGFTLDTTDPDIWEYDEIKADQVPDGITPTSVGTLPAASSTADEYVTCDGKYYKLYEKTVANSNTPFYTYPMEWEFTDQYEPYLFIMVPWKNTGAVDPDDPGAGTRSFQEVYYKVMLGQKSMAYNDWYDITINLNVLGSFDKVAPTQQYLHEKYVVKNWINAFDEEKPNNVDADIKTAHYLVFDEDQYVLNNQKSLSIPFSSSHQCVIKEVTVKKTNFKTNQEKVLEGEEYDASWVTLNGSVVELNHALNNDLNHAKTDVSPYTFTIVVGHVGTTAYNKTITVVQYPAVYIEVEFNSTVHATSSGFSSAANSGWVYVNGNHDTKGNSSSAGNAGNWESVSNSYSVSGATDNPFMTVITVSQLDDSQNYIIGDPRVKSSVKSDDVPSWWADAGSYNAVQAPALYDGATNRRLKYYYETGGAAYENYIAPKLRLVSGYSYNNGGRTYKKNLTRCASYQEDGFPAGRWRLPTKAEIEFIKKIEAKGLILQLFAGETKYWCPTGYWSGTSYTDVNNILDNTSTTGCSRCVYDEWYWEKVDAENGWDGAARTARRSTFTWGDMPIYGKE